MKTGKHSKLLPVILTFVIVITALPLSSVNSFAYAELHTSSDGQWEYYINADGTINVTNCFSVSNTITLYPEIDGYSVNVYMEGVFMGYYISAHELVIMQGAKTEGGVLRTQNGVIERVKDYNTGFVYDIFDFYPSSMYGQVQTPYGFVNIEDFISSQTSRQVAVIQEYIGDCSDKYMIPETICGFYIIKDEAISQYCDMYSTNFSVFDSSFCCVDYEYCNDKGINYYLCDTNSKLTYDVIDLSSNYNYYDLFGRETFFEELVNYYSTSYGIILTGTVEPLNTVIIPETIHGMPVVDIYDESAQHWEYNLDANNNAYILDSTYYHIQNYSPDISNNYGTVRYAGVGCELANTNTYTEQGISYKIYNLYDYENNLIYDITDLSSGQYSYYDVTGKEVYREELCEKYSTNYAVNIYRTYKPFTSLYIPETIHGMPVVNIEISDNKIPVEAWGVTPDINNEIRIYDGSAYHTTASNAPYNYSEPSLGGAGRGLVEYFNNGNYNGNMMYVTYLLYDCADGLVYEPFKLTDSDEIYYTIHGEMAENYGIAEQYSTNYAVRIEGIGKTVNNIVIPETIHGMPVVDVDAEHLERWRALSSTADLHIYDGTKYHKGSNSTFNMGVYGSGYILPDIIRWVGNSSSNAVYNLYDYADDLVYVVDNDNIRITSTLKNPTAVVIPAEINGISVTDIEDYAFAECSGLRSITVPKSIRNIGGNAFMNCYNLCEAYCYYNSVFDNYYFDHTVIKHYYGDVDGDGAVNLSDYAVYKSYITDGLEFTAESEALDLNNDMTIDAFDMYYIDRLMNGLI